MVVAHVLVVGAVEAGRNGAVTVVVALPLKAPLAKLVDPVVSEPVPARMPPVITRLSMTRSMSGVAVPLPSVAPSPTPGEPAGVQRLGSRQLPLPPSHTQSMPQAGRCRPRASGW
jgi:hypothetical protein